MGKNEFILTPKAIAKGMKAKGLQKLQWYCQMCQKQCRDENGFKCHCISESHQRQMEIFGQCPDRIVEGYTEEFEFAFLDHMKRSHRFSRVSATVVYNEYISDRHHVHMNSTKWLSLSEFVRYLGRTGKCKVDETPKGWFISYIDRDSETFFKYRQKKKRAREDMVEEEKKEKELLKQIERVAELLPEKEMSEKERADVVVARKVAFALGGSMLRVSAAGNMKEIGQGSNSKGVFEDDHVEAAKVKKAKTSGSVLEEIMEEEEKVKERINRKDYWLCEGIIVKVISKKSGYYNKKGVVQKVTDKYVGEIEMVDTKERVRVDQAELETVLPQIGGLVRIVNGAYRGSKARLLAIDTDKYCAKVQIEKGVYDGRVLQAVEYEDISKVV